MTVPRGLVPIAGAGLEPSPNSPKNAQFPEQRGTDSGTLSLPADLAEVVNGWNYLPEPSRAGIMAIFRASIPQAGSAEQ